MISIGIIFFEGFRGNKYFWGKFLENFVHVLSVLIPFTPVSPVVENNFSDYHTGK